VNEAGVEQEQVVTIIRCVDCGISGTRSWGGPTQRYYNKDDLRNNQCPECEERWEKEMWDMSRGKRMTRQLSQTSFGRISMNNGSFLTI